MPYKKDYLTEEEKELLPILLAEAESRGLLPQIRANLERKRRRTSRPFPKDSNGYYFKYNGTKFTPNDDQGKFIKSLAYFVALIGGRGGGKTSSGSQKILNKIEAGEPG